ncbi:MAG: hypothetical protein J6B92_06520 [Paraprevotella sp.]|nr:hypothetical protein [Paraprevotella sp.]
MKTKKAYIAPSTELHRVEVETMLALSVIGGEEADQGGEVLGSDGQEWNIWTE